VSDLDLFSNIERCKNTGLVIYEIHLGTLD
jgi:hypothetical protein